MKLKFLLLLLAGLPLLFNSNNLIAQSSGFQRYIIEFKDKENSPYSIDEPDSYLSQRAITRRVRYNIPITEIDLPVNPQYVEQVIGVGVKLLNKSKWLNSISVVAEDSTLIAAINEFPFVKSSYPIAPRKASVNQISKSGEIEYAGKIGEYAPLLYGKAANQLDMLNGSALHKQGYKGEGMIIAVMDAGFFNVPALQVFDSLIEQGRLLGTWNFVHGHDSVFNYSGHGTSVLSTIAANIPGIMVGSGPGAGIYLFVTEDASSEYPIEEHNWAAGAELADSLGADIITSSLGYSRFDNTQFNHNYDDLDGNTTMITRAADFAASKGIIVCSSAGNEGNSDWYYITAPADADSILSVGAVDSVGLLTAFSSNGPSADGDVKPNVVAQGIRTAVVEPFSGMVVTGNGTSFSNPLIAGITACLWQAHPDKNNMEVMEAIQKSASLYYNPNDSMGYGIPNFEVADLLLAGKAPDNLALTAPLVYPNPFQQNFSILYYTARTQQLEVQLFDILGRMVQSFNTSLSIGYNHLPVVLFENRSNGLYFLSLNFDDHREVVKVIKED